MFEILISALLTLSKIPDLDQNSLFLNEKNLTQTNQEINKNNFIKLNSSIPVINSKSSLVADLNSNFIFYQENANQKLPIASLTKLMTALIILEEHDLNEIVTITPQATSIGGSSMYLQSNEKISIQNLLYGLMIQSGNDAAIALALHNSDSLNTFIKKMNSRAKELNLKNTNFDNPMGFDSEKNYSTAQDLFLLAKEVLKYPEIFKIVSHKSIKVQSTDNQITHNLESTNDLLGNYLNINGLKTGTTNLAGGCFIGITDNENPMIAIVIGSNNRFKDSKILLDWAKNNFKLTQ